MKNSAVITLSRDKDENIGDNTFSQGGKNVKSRVQLTKITMHHKSEMQRLAMEIDKIEDPSANLPDINCCPMPCNVLDSYIAKNIDEIVTDKLGPQMNSSVITSHTIYQLMWKLAFNKASLRNNIADDNDTVLLNGLLQKWLTNAKQVQTVTHQELAILCLYLSNGYAYEVQEKEKQDPDLLGKVLGSLLSVLNDSSLDPATQCMSITCLAFLIEHHDIKDSVLLPKNLKQLLRLSFSRAVYPTVPANLSIEALSQRISNQLDSTFGRIAIRQLLSIDSVNIQASTQAELKQFVEKWWLRILQSEGSIAGNAGSVPSTTFALETLADVFVLSSEVRQWMLQRCLAATNNGTSFIRKLLSVPNSNQDVRAIAAGCRLVTYMMQDAAFVICTQQKLPLSVDQLSYLINLVVHTVALAFEGLKFSKTIAHHDDLDQKTSMTTTTSKSKSAASRRSTRSSTNRAVLADVTNMPRQDMTTGDGDYWGQLASGVINGPSSKSTNALIQFIELAYLDLTATALTSLYQLLTQLLSQVDDVVMCLDLMNHIEQNVLTQEHVAVIQGSLHLTTSDRCQVLQCSALLCAIEENIKIFDDCSNLSTNSNSEKNVTIKSRVLLMFQSSHMHADGVLELIKEQMAPRKSYERAVPYTFLSRETVRTDASNTEISSNYAHVREQLARFYQLFIDCFPDQHKWTATEHLSLTGSQVLNAPMLIVEPSLETNYDSCGRVSLSQEIDIYPPPSSNVRLPTRSPFRIQQSSSASEDHVVDRHEQLEGQDTGRKAKSTTSSSTSARSSRRRSSTSMTETQLSPSLSSPPIRRLRQGKTPLTSASASKYRQHQLTKSVSIEDFEGELSLRSNANEFGRRTDTDPDLQCYQDATMSQLSPILGCCPTGNEAVDSPVQQDSDGSMHRGDCVMNLMDEEECPEYSALISMCLDTTSHALPPSATVSNVANPDPSVGQTSNNNNVTKQTSKLSRALLATLDSPPNSGRKESNPASSCDTTMSPSVQMQSSHKKKKAKTPPRQEQQLSLQQSLMNAVLSSTNNTSANEVALRQEIFDLRLKLSEFESSDAFLRNSNSELERANAALTKELTTVSRRAEELKLQEAGQALEIVQYKQMLGGLNSRISELEDNRAVSTVRMEEQQQTVKLQEKALQEAWDQLAALGRTASQQQTEIKSAAIRLEQKESQYQQSVELAQRLEADCRGLNAKMEYLQQRNQELENLSGNTAHTLKIKDKSLAVLEAKLQSMNAAERIRIEEINLLNTKIMTMDSALKHSEDQIRNQHRHISELNDVLASKDVEINQQQEQLKQIASTVDDLTGNLQRMRQELQISQALIREKDQQHTLQVDAYREQVSSLDSKVSELSQDLDKHQQLIVMINKLSAKPAL
jgi:uncharacterized coiled-coil protein SlyX